MTDDVLIAHIHHSQDAHIWRLRLPATPERPEGGSLDLPGFSGSLADGDDAMRIEIILRAEGYTPAMGRWRAEGGAFVVPILKYSHPHI
ncbi:hypothetical protein [Microbacterium testaceum]|uniref:hypothetical protein n=1 Tax=Microbacterium testaceum TaxID=2033 RepID=UPI002435314A|nr:hypothetical protein [Microbacterium testaceum]